MCDSNATRSKLFHFGKEGEKKRALMSVYRAFAEECHVDGSGFREKKNVECGTCMRKEQNR